MHFMFQRFDKKKSPDIKTNPMDIRVLKLQILAHIRQAQHATEIFLYYLHKFLQITVQEEFILEANIKINILRADIFLLFLHRQKTF